ncbi:MAG: thermonuclease family protein [Myxococcales bacterium]|jgi:endonuclease YncB( thermonuclease family)
MKARFPQLFVALAALLLAAGCPPTKAARRYNRQQAAESLRTLDKAGLVIGEFPIDGKNAILDGDTIAITGLDSTLRLIGVDTEETFKHEWELKAYAKGFEAYKKEMRGDSARPVKMATPVGMEAKEWAKKFFDGVTTVRLERDHPGEIRGYYGRYLAYVFAQKKGQWLNYNIEAVRAGMSPYFTKYGQSRRFHKEFLAAQAEAQAKQLGIWDPNKEHYDDYPERLKWWNARGEVIERFERMSEGRDNHIVLTRWDALLELEKRVGQEAVILGSVGDISLGDKGPTIVELSRNQHSSFDLVFFDKDIFKATGLSQKKGEYVAVRGVVRKYKDKRRGDERLQFIITLPGQVSFDGAAPTASPLVEPPPPPPPAPAEIPVVSADPSRNASTETIPVVSADPSRSAEPEQQDQPVERPRSPGAIEPDPDDIPADLNFDDLSELPLEP